jgi:hypothetical protein
LTSSDDAAAGSKRTADADVVRAIPAIKRSELLPFMINPPPPARLRLVSGLIPLSIRPDETNS